MNKRTLLLGGGLTALLASLAVYQTYNDTSTFSASNAESLKILEAEKATVFQAEILQASGSTSTASKINITRLTNAYTQLYADMIPSSNLRLTAYPTTDRVVYRKDDYLILEVFLFDTLLKTPYIPPATNIPTVDLRINLYDSDSSQVGVEKAIAGNLAPTIAVTLPLLQFGTLTPDTYTLVISDGANRQFPETSVSFQVREFVSEQTDLGSNSVGASIQIFGDYSVKTGLATDSVTVYGKIQAAPGTACPSSSRSLTFENIPTTKDVTAVPSAPVTLNDFAPDGQLYFSFSVDEDVIVDSRDNTLLVVIGSDSAACGDDLKVYIQFGDDREPEPYTTADLNVDFVTQDNGDLVSNTTQTVYYHAYFQAQGSDVIEAIAITDAVIYSYNLDAPWEEPVILASGLQSDANGFGNATIAIPDNTQLFLEFQLEQFSEVEPDNLDIVTPWAYTIILGDGYFRVPINPDSITGYKKEILLRQLFQTGTTKMISYINTLNIRIDDAPLALSYYFENGLFYIEDGSNPIDPVVIAKFNSFPNPENFTDSVLFTYSLYYPDPDDLANVRVIIRSFDLQAVISSMAEKFVSYLNTLLSTNAPATLVAAAGGTTDDMLLFMYQSFEPVDQLVYAELTHYNADGPVTDFIEGDNGYAYIGDPEYEPSSFEQPAITMTINDNVLGSQQDLVVNFQTNNLMDPTKAYLLTVKQKEQVIYSEAFSFSQNTNQKRTIPYGKINKMNGGVFSVDLYKISDLYVATETAITTTSGVLMCNLNLLVNPTTFSWGTAAYATDKARVEELDTPRSQADLLTTDLITTNAYFVPSSTLSTNPVRAAFKTCIVDSPELLSNYLTQVGQSQFYRKPQPAINVQVSTNKAQYTKGETVSVTVTLTNMTDNTVGITSGAYLSLLVVEDLEFTEADLQTRSLGERIYISDEIDEMQTEDLSDIINKQYDPSLSSIADSPLRQLMAHQLAYNKLYQPSTLLENDYISLVEIDHFGLEHFELCDRYGYRFDKFSTAYSDNTGVLNFKQLQIENYLNQGSSVGFRDYSNDILGYTRSYPKNQYQTVFTSKDTFGTFATSSPKRVTSVFKQTITDTLYDRNADTYLREVLYFQTGVAITGQTNTYTFQTGDILSNFKVKAVVVHPNGIGYDQTSFTTAKPFQVELDYPSVMVQGELYTLSATIVNMSPQNMNVTVSRLGTEDNNENTAAVFVDFSTSFSNSNLTNAGVVITKYITVPAGSSGTIDFQVEASMIGQALATLNFVASSLRIISSSSNFTTTYTDSQKLNILVVKPYPRRHQYSSGLIFTGFGSDYEASDSVSFKIDIPVSSTEEDIDQLQGDLLIMSSRLGMLEVLLDGITSTPPSEFPNTFANALEVVSVIEMLGLKVSSIEKLVQEETNSGPNPASNAQTYFYYDRIEEAYIKEIELLKYVDERYGVKNASGHCIGYDYYENDYENGGSLSLTAYTLRVVANFVQFAFQEFDMDYLFDEESCFSTSLEWILSKQVQEWNADLEEYEIVGNYTMDPLDVDAQGRAPWNITQAFVTSQLIGTVIELPLGGYYIPDMAAQVEFMIEQITDSFTPNSAFDIDLDSDPYYIALGLNTMNAYFIVLQQAPTTQSILGANIPALLNWYAVDADGAKVWKDQLLYHQFTQARFPTSYNNSFDSFRPFFSYTPFNSYKVDRVIETTALVCRAVLGFSLYTEGGNSALQTETQAAVRLGLNFIRSNNRGGWMGSITSTLEAIRSFGFFEITAIYYKSDRSGSSFPPVSPAQEISFLITRDVVTTPPNLESTTVSYTQDYIIPRRFNIFEDVVSFPGWEAGEYEISITMASDLGGSPANSDNTFVTYSFETAIYDYEFLGELDAEGSNIYLEVYSNNDINVKEVGEYVEYQVTLMNYDRGRSHNGIVFVVRPSPCLAIDTDYLDQGITAGDYINYQVDASTHSISIYGRGVGPFGYPTFTLAFEKRFGNPDTDTCVERFFSAQLSGFEASLVHAYPADASPDAQP